MPFLFWFYDQLAVAGIFSGDMNPGTYLVYIRCLEKRVRKYAIC